MSQTGSTTALPTADSGWAGEISLDLDMASAICPNCHITLVEAKSASMANLGTAVNEAVALGAEYPAASRYVTAVGGTRLPTSSTTRGWTESVWRTSSTEGTGSGCSAYDTKPAWQTDTGCAKRMIADVSAVADPATGVSVYDTYGADGQDRATYGGTSASPRYLLRGPARGPLASGPGMTVAPCRRDDLGGGVTGPEGCRHRR